MFTYPKKSVIFIIADNSALARLRNKERERMNSLNDIWSSVLAVLGQNLTATALNTWFDDCTPVEIVNNRLVIHTPTEFKRDIIQTRFAQTIVDALSDIFSAEFKLTILAGDELDSYILSLIHI